MSVAAVDIDNEHAEFSNVWDNNCISAPGVAIYSSVPNNSYDSYSGTSMATPHLTGVAAMARSFHPTIDQDDLIRILTRTAQKLGRQTDPNNWATYGAGLLRADELVKELYHEGGPIWKRRAIL
jgi:subtilisin family serine protease